MVPDTNCAPPSRSVCCTRWPASIMSSMYSVGSRDTASFCFDAGLQSRTERRPRRQVHAPAAGVFQQRLEVHEPREGRLSNATSTSMSLSAGLAAGHRAEDLPCSDSELCSEAVLVAVHGIGDGVHGHCGAHPTIDHSNASTDAA